MESVLIFLIGMAAGVALSLIVVAIIARHYKQLAHQQAIETEKRYKEAMEERDRMNKELMDSQQQRFDTTLEKVTAQMKTATDEMLKERQREFAETSKTGLDQILTPLRENIKDMKKAMEEDGKSQENMRGEMRSTINRMMEQSKAAKESADELARAFKHQSKVQGDWGEIVLNELLEKQGLTRGTHYEVQATLTDQEGNAVTTDGGSRLRPDVILHLDQRRDVVIDSKVSMTAFIDYVNAETEQERQLKLKEHLESINRHVAELSKKDYSAYIPHPRQSVGYVIMFIPHSGALWTALNVQPDLWRKAMELNVFIADEQTLYAALKIVSLTWTKITQEENHAKIFALADQMLARVGLFVERYKGIGKALDNARQAYEAGEKTLTQGKSIITTCHNLQRMGAKQDNRHPLPDTPTPSLPDDNDE